MKSKLMARGSRAAEQDASVIEDVAKSGAEVIDLQFSDIAGGTKGLTIPAASLEAALARGYRFDGSALTGGDRQAELDLYLMPDVSTLELVVPGSGAPPRARLYCSVRRHDGRPFPGDPRSNLERVLDEAAAAGYDYRIGLEIEYYLLRRVPADTAATFSPPRDAAGYFDVGADLIAGTRDEIVTTLQGMGVGVGGAHHETGPGQEELDLLPTGGIRMADQLMTVRQVIRSVAARRGLRATFMPKPLPDAPGSGMHLLQHLADYPAGNDLIRTHDGDGLAKTARHMIAGQLAHAAAICAVACPTVNSYKRLNAGHRAPRYARWARVGEASLVRVPAGSEDQPGALELRSPDAMANPYLAVAVAVACALDGIRRADTPPDPLDESLVAYDDSELERLGTPRLPENLGDALAALSEDDVIRATLGDYIFDQFLTVKRDEWAEYRRQVTPWEHERYADA
ncbi:MAG TPA: glutamine synthetase family protein [Thermomicrobiales bacterium]|nr:glutamine synthetase family protein [Thermomicrobiales bacterium]